MKKNRRKIEVFSISFLDIITAGFGAIILLLLIARSSEPPSLEPQSQGDAVLQEQVLAMQRQRQALTQALDAKREELAAWKEKVARLQNSLSRLQAQEIAQHRDASSQASLKEELQLALQELTAEMQRLQAQRREIRDDSIGGIPVDSEYIVFVIDTSGSMFNLAWNRVMEEMIAVLKVYPQVKGIQILNDMGEYMFSSYGRQEWIPDTPGRRKIIIERLRTWNPFSNSSPVEGIQKAIRTLYHPERKISIYVFGDDFTGNSIHQVVAEVERLNPKNDAGIPQIRIHGIGFPVQFANPQQQITGVRFATLMRVLTRRNRGTFVGLNDFRPR
jgi:hypothetical protein